MKSLISLQYYKFYYFIKPLVPRAIQIWARRKLSQYKQQKYSMVWPIDKTAGEKPKGWGGWPDNKRFALVLTHDVDTSYGNENCIKLMELEKSLGFRSTFFFVPNGYPAPKKYHDELIKNGFDIGVHGLKHDGKLFWSKKGFLKKAGFINRVYSKMGCIRVSGSMHAS